MSSNPAVHVRWLMLTIWIFSVRVCVLVGVAYVSRMHSSRLLLCCCVVLLLHCSMLVLHLALFSVHVIFLCLFASALLHERSWVLVCTAFFASARLCVCLLLDIPSWMDSCVCACADPFCCQGRFHFIKVDVTIASLLLWLISFWAF